MATAHLPLALRTYVEDSNLRVYSSTRVAALTLKTCEGILIVEIRYHHLSDEVCDVSVRRMTTPVNSLSGPGFIVCFGMEVINSGAQVTACVVLCGPATDGHSMSRRLLHLK